MSLPLLVGLAGFPLLALAVLPFATGRSIALGVLYRIGQVALIALVVLLSLFLFVPETSALASRFDPVCDQLGDDLPGYGLAEECVGRWLLLGILVVVVGLSQLMLIGNLRKRVLKETRIEEDPKSILPRNIEHPEHRPLLIKDIVQKT